MGLFSPLLAVAGRVDEAVAVFRMAYETHTLSPFAILRALAVPAFRNSEAARTLLREIGLAET